MLAFLAYCLIVTLAPGLRPKAVLEKLGAIQMLDVWLPTTDGRWLMMPRYTEPETEQVILLHKLQLRLPPQPPPRIKLQHPSQTAEALRSSLWCRLFKCVWKKRLRLVFPSLMRKFG
jgi:hypothetical protein